MAHLCTNETSKQLPTSKKEAVHNRVFLWILMGSYVFLDLSSLTDLLVFFHWGQGWGGQWGQMLYIDHVTQL